MAVDLQRLHDAIKKSSDKLERFRAERTEAIKQFVGKHYSENGAEKNMPVNLLELAVTIYLRLLAARAPCCVVKTESRSLMPFASDMEIVLNQLPDEIKLGDTLRRAVMEALFGIGVVKVGIAGIDDRPNFGDEPFVSLVTIDDYFVDMSARSWDEIQYEGNDYWVTVDEAESYFGVKLKSDDYDGIGPNGEEQANAVTNNESGAEYNDRVLLRDVYLRKDGVMVTYAVENIQLIREVAWDGPEGTPYIKLWFSDVPSNLLPLPSTSLWMDLNDMANTLFRKVRNQAVAKKSVVLFSGGSDEQTNRFCNAADGSAMSYSGTRPEEVSVGGVDNAAVALVLSVNDMLSRMAGNLDSLGGLAVQSQTATQDKLLNEAASSRVSAMSKSTMDFARAIFKRLAWYVWTDPVRERKYRRHLSREMNIGVDKMWTPETRDGDFLDYNIDIDVFSMQDDSPAVRVQKLGEVMNNFVFPMMQMLIEQGAVIDARFLMSYLAKNTNMPELDELVKFNPPTSANDPESVGKPQPDYVSTKSPVTKRTYERVNRPGKMTSQGKTAVMVQALLGQNVQNADAAGATGANMM